ncbi:MAG: hypothetical protein ACHQF2_08810 [Flavobacteriales bacterium]
MDSRDPRFRKGKVPPAFIIKKTKKGKDWHWSLTVLIAGGIGGSILTMMMMSFTMLSWLYVVLGMLGVGAIAFLIQWKHFYNPVFFEKYFRIHISIYLIYNFVGIGFTVVSLTLLINWLGAGEILVERHRIVGIDNNYVRDSNALTVMLLENDAYQDDPYMRAAPYMQVRRKTFPFFDILYRDGLFGIKIYEGYKMSRDLNAKPEVELVEEVVESEEIPVDSVLTDSSLVPADSL